MRYISVGGEASSAESTPLRGRSRPTSPTPRLAPMSHGLFYGLSTTEDELVHQHGGRAADHTPARVLFDDPPNSTVSLSRSRLYALVAVCTMSIGSHFAMYQLGPLKSRLHRELGTSNAQFSLLIAAFNLNSTWTPLVAGVLVARFGTGLSSVATTGCILAGQLVLFLGVVTGHIVIMTLGLFVFGLGVTPLAVVQETLVSRLSPSKHLGVSLALGLVSGKMASFVSSLVSLPLADRYGDAVPFGMSVVLCAGSFAANAARLACGWGSEVGGGAVTEKRMVSWGGVSRLGDVFWLYILLNVFSGMIWAPFLHLSANLVRVRYDLTESFAAAQAAILLSGALVLYPITGLITDRLSPHTPRTTFRLLLLSSLLTLSAYTFLSLPPRTTATPMPGMVLFTLGHGMATLLMVILVPRFLPPELVPLGLGLHKSMEMASSAVSQTAAGVWLDMIKAEVGARVGPGVGATAGEDDAGRQRHLAEGEGKGSPGAGELAGGKEGAEGLLRIFWLINALQLGCAVSLWALEEARRKDIARSGASDGHGGAVSPGAYERLPMNDLPPLSDSDEVSDSSGEEEDGEGEGAGLAGERRRRYKRRRRDRRNTPPLDQGGNAVPESGQSISSARDTIGVGSTSRLGKMPSTALARNENERARGKVFLGMSLGWVVLVWIVFLVDAYMDLLG